MPLTYSKYLKIDQLLNLQKPLSEGPEHDEMLFIVIHQVYELWFKQMLHEANYLVKNLNINKRTEVLRTFKRMLTILKTLVAQIDVLETMTPLTFNSFRDRLESSSGFQSVQFREFEFVLGNKNRGMMTFFPKEYRERLDKALNSPSLYQHFLKFLSLNDIQIPESAFEINKNAPTQPREDLQQILIEIYRGRPFLAEVCERLLDLDEGLQEWRYRHIKMVERTIGSKMGTGGSSGAEYLKSTLFKPLFPDLWHIRQFL